MGDLSCTRQPFISYSYLKGVRTQLVAASMASCSVAVVRSKDADCLDRTDFGPDQTARAVCSLKTEKYGPDHRPTPDRD